MALRPRSSWKMTCCRNDSVNTEEGTISHQMGSRGSSGMILRIEELTFDRKLHRADDVDGMQILAGRAIKNLDLILSRFPSVSRF